jgi:hypothetical protein
MNRFSLLLSSALLLLPAGLSAQQIAAMTSPAGPGSIQPNWAVAQDGSILLSWVEPAKNDTYTLKYAVRRGNAWSEARTIATGRQFWRHPAEIPNLLSLPDGTLMAEWVEKGKGEAEYILVSTSRDGTQWSAPQMVHKDRSEVQHGLASIVASGPGEASIFWLQALQGEDGPVSLMRSVVSADGKEIKEEELDQDVCSCCPTSVAKTAKGLLVAYRGHTPKDIRDIYVVRFENGKWLPSKNLNPDKWEINACPVNAASVAANGNRVAISWYTEADDMARVQMVFSSDSGATFGKPVVLSKGSALGYASTALNNDGSAVISWIEEGEKAASVKVRQVSAAGAPGPAVQVAEGGRQSLGYPRLVHAGNETWIVWGDSKAGIRTARLK